MTAVADILPIAKPQAAAAAPAPAGDGEDFFDHLLREVERREAPAEENPSETRDDTEAADAAAAPAEAVPPPTPTLTLPWSLAAATPLPVVPPADAAPAAASPLPAVPPLAPPGEDQAPLPVPPATTATPAVPTPPVTPPTPVPAATPAAAPVGVPSPPANATAAATTAAPAPAAPQTTTPAETTAATPPAGMARPDGVTTSEGDAVEAETILQVIGPRLPQATAAAPAPAMPAPVLPVAVSEPAPLRTLREAAPAPSAATAGGNGIAATAPAGGMMNSGGAKTGSGDLGFKTDLGSVFAALSASGDTADAADFSNLVTNQAVRGIATELPATEARPAGGPAPAAVTAPLAAATQPQAAVSAEPVHHAAAARPAPATPATPATLQISVQMIRALGEGVSKINVDLTPAELGRVEVRIEVGSDGRVQGTVTADRQDTFDMLQRDSRALERALQDAGLKADPQSLSFNLRGESQQGRTAPENPVQEAFGTDSMAEDAPPPPPPPGRPAGNPVGAVDIRV